MYANNTVVCRYRCGIMAPGWYTTSTVQCGIMTPGDIPQAQYSVVSWHQGDIPQAKYIVVSWHQGDIPQAQYSVVSGPSVIYKMAWWVGRGKRRRMIILGELQCRSRSQGAFVSNTLMASRIILVNAVDLLFILSLYIQRTAPDIL